LIKTLKDLFILLDKQMETDALRPLFERYGIQDVLPQIQVYVDDYNKKLNKCQIAVSVEHWSQ